jgi:SAM-dependent methyltransferase
VSIADIGTGSGVVACLIADALPRASVVGIDSSATAPERAAAFASSIGVYNVRFQTGDAERLPFPPATFDLVYSDQLLQYTNERITFAEIARVLRPGGRTVLIVPNAANLVFTATALAAGDRHGSRRVYTRRRLRRLALGSGLQILEWDGYLPAYPIQRVGYFYLPWMAPIGTAAEALCDRLDSLTDRWLSRRFGFALAVIAERPHQ